MSDITKIILHENQLLSSVSTTLGIIFTHNEIMRRGPLCMTFKSRKELAIKMGKCMDTFPSPPAIDIDMTHLVSYLGERGKH